MADAPKPTNPTGPTAVQAANQAPQPTAAPPAAPAPADIIRFPHGYGDKGGHARTIQALKKEFGPLLGNPKQIWFGRNGDFTLAHAKSFEPLYFAKGSAREDQERYTWEKKGEIELGRKVEGADDAD